MVSYFLANFLSGAKANPMFGNHFEGDMVLTDTQRRALSGFGFVRNGVKKLSLRWKNRIIPYELASTFPSEDIKQIVGALKTLQSLTCIKLVPRKNETDYVQVKVIQFYAEIILKL